MIYLKGHFIPSGLNNIFITQIGEVSGDTAILCLPSITEELNLARAVCARQMHAFAHHNLPAFILDYQGTGDSEGDFEQVNVETWLNDILTAGAWLKELGINNIILFGIRFGALLALHFQHELHNKLPIKQQIFWKPVINGKQFFGQFIRIKQASEMMKNNAEKIDWRQKVLQGNDIEVAGYTLNENLLKSAELCQVAKPFLPSSPIHWFEFGTASVPIVITNLISQDPSQLIQLHHVQCPPFWQVPEVFDCPELIDLTLSVMQKGNSFE